MTIQKVVFTNFGVYAGRNEFDLAPRTDSQFNRPVVFLSGKNGAGKTTFVEGIRICLHGSLALGDRVRQKDYDQHLLRRIHRPFDGDAEQPEEASIEIEFDFVRSGEPRHYRVKRKWHRTKKSVSEELTIKEDGSFPEGLTEDQKGGFLREMIPSSAADLFFFDGEKINELTQDKKSTEILEKTVKSLLGLHLVDRLDDDLQVYIQRRAEADKSAVSNELKQARKEVNELEERRTELIQLREETESAINEKRSAINEQRQRIKSEGGDYAERRNELEQKKESLTQEIEAQKKHVQGLADGIFPFAVAPDMCRKVQKRLKLEREHQRWRTSKDLIEAQVSSLEREIDTESFWEEVEIEAGQEKKERLLASLSKRLRSSNPAKPVDEEEVIIHASERERGKLNNWIDEALSTAPDRFRKATQHLKDLKSELESVEQDLERVPEDLILQPLVETLNTLQNSLDDLQERSENIADEIGTVLFKLERAQNHLERTEEKLEEEQAENERINRAIKTKKAFRDYANRLKERKLAIVENILTKRFNQLCRKDGLIDGVTIDPETFHIDLHRGGETFGREELSMGEKQLFAISTIWALREVSGVPMPVIIDTPLGRLDGDHRSNMVQKYLPRASHQVMLLATDTEVDEQLLDELSPALSHAYRLNYDDSVSRTVVEEIDTESTKQAIFEYEEVPA